MNDNSMKKVLALNLLGFLSLLFLEYWCNNFVYAWLDLRLLLVFLLLNFVFYLIFINKKEKYGK